jgi:hypothetical protein
VDHEVFKDQALQGSRAVLRPWRNLVVDDEALRPIHPKALSHSGRISQFKSKVFWLFSLLELGLAFRIGLKSNQKATPSQSNTTRRNQTKKEPH